MAVTAIWAIKGRAEKVIAYAANPAKTNDYTADELQSIADILEYAEDSTKTERCEYVSCLNCELEYAAQQFTDTKRLWRKQGGRVCYHGYQSFRAEEVDAQTAHNIGIKLAEEIWGDCFEVVVSTHCNTGHYHNHFVINSVSFADGHKFANSPADYRRMRETSDRLCREYGISVIREPKNKGKHYAEWQSEQKGQITQRSLIRADIDRAIAASTTERDFMRAIADMGYTLKIYGKSGAGLKYPAIKPPDGKCYFRLYKLGEGYNLAEIRERVLRNVQKQPPLQLSSRHKSPEARPRIKTDGLSRVYYRYCYELHILVKKPTSVQRVSAMLREDIIRLDKLDAETRLLGRNDIKTAAELTAYRQKTEAEIEKLKFRRRALNKDDDDEVANINERLKKLRREVVLCKDIAERSALVDERLELLLEEQVRTQMGNQNKEAEKDELFRRRGGAGRANEP